MMTREEVLEKCQTLLIRCSALGKIMGAGRSIGLTDKQKETVFALKAKPKLTEIQAKDLEDLERKALCVAEFSLSETAKTYVKSIVRQMIYEYDDFFTSKETDKGIFCEDEAIGMQSEFDFTTHSKNEISQSNEWLKGTCDILEEGEKRVTDIKCPWSKMTFPDLEEDAANSDYEWQIRGYMWLYGCDKGRLAYWLLDTPDHLLEWEKNYSIHKMNNLPTDLRCTFLHYDRNSDAENFIKDKVLECRRFAAWYAEKIYSKNK